MRGPVHLKRVTLDTTIVCTRSEPWKRSMCSPGILVLHPDAVEVKRPMLGGEQISRECPNCGYAWPVEQRIVKTKETMKGDGNGGR